MGNDCCKIVNIAIALGDEEMATTNDKIKMSQDGVKELMDQIDQAILDFAGIQKSINSAMDSLDASLVGASKNAFSNKSTIIKNGLVSQNKILENIKGRALTSANTMLQIDKQIAGGIGR